MMVAFTALILSLCKRENVVLHPHMCIRTHTCSEMCSSTSSSWDLSGANSFSVILYIQYSECSVHSVCMYVVCIYSVCMYVVCIYSVCMYVVCIYSVCMYVVCIYSVCMYVVCTVYDVSVQWSV